MKRISCLGLMLMTIALTGMWCHVDANELKDLLKPFRPYQQSLEDELRRAASEGDIGTIRKLVANGARINALDRDGWSPLALAVANNHPDAVKALLDLRATPSPVLKTRHSPLGWAVIRGYRDLVELLLAKGADIEARDEKGWTPLMEASARGYSDVVELLLAKGANPNAKDPCGATSLNLSGVYERDDVSNVLLSKGADPAIKLHRIAIARGVTVPPPKNIGEEGTALALNQHNGPRGLNEPRAATKFAMLPAPETASGATVRSGRGMIRPLSQARVPRPAASPAMTVGESNPTFETDRRRAAAMSLLKQGLTIWTQLSTRYPEIAGRLQDFARNNPSLDVLAKEMKKGF